MQSIFDGFTFHGTYIQQIKHRNNECKYLFFMASTDKYEVETSIRVTHINMLSIFDGFTFHGTYMQQTKHRYN